jgi:heterodisulfide reductase subunit C
VPTLVDQILALTGSDIRRCEACRDCSARFALKNGLDLSSTEFIRKALDNDREAIFRSHALWLMSGCQARRVVCEQGVDFAAVLGALRRLALESGAPPAEPEIALLMRTFADQVRTLGRSHLRALLKTMRLRTPGAATEGAQELAMLFKHKLLLFPQKVRDIESVRKLLDAPQGIPSPPSGGEGQGEGAKNG